MHVVHAAGWFIHSAIKTTGIRKNNENIWWNVKLQVHAKQHNLDSSRAGKLRVMN